jgi:hypothetical protein
VLASCAWHAAPGDRKGVFQCARQSHRWLWPSRQLLRSACWGGISAGAASPGATAATLAAQAGPAQAGLARALQPAAAPGAQLWIHRWRGAAAFNRVAASPDGSKVFVTGLGPGGLLGPGLRHGRL